MNFIQHEGQVIRIVNGTATVSLWVNSGCSSCQAKSACALSERKEKIVDVSLPNDRAYRVGDPVLVRFQKKNAFEAVALAYLLPFLLSFSLLLLIYGATGNELISGLIAVGILAPWFTALYFLRDKIKERFNFQLVKHAGL